MDEIVVQGRRLGDAEIAWIRGLMAAHPQWRRTHLSVHIARQWNWRNAAGQLKDMAARTMLLKLEQRGLLRLPPRRTLGLGNRKAFKVEPEPELDLFGEPVVSSSLAELLPLQVIQAQNTHQRRWMARLFQQHHYLGFCRPVGENLPYLVESQNGDLLACVLFGAAAWKCAPRDEFIGWSPEMRQMHLPLVVNNTRLLIVPWARVPHLGSHLLGILAKRLSQDWQCKYGHPVHLLETFVEQNRFVGTVYRAANWIHVGQTQGRGRHRNSSTVVGSIAIKDVYLRVLNPRFRQLLGGLTCQHAR